MPNILAGPGRSSGNPRPLSVSQLTDRIRGALEEEFGAVQVEGEISGWTEAASGHCYFSLKDPGALLQSVMWKGTRGRLRFRPREGMKVVCTGKLTVYEKRGQYQLQVDAMREAGEGDLWARFQLMKAKLDGEGLFDATRKRRPPVYPRCVGIVTSPTGAALQDMLAILSRRAPGLPILIHPAKVQGLGAAAEVARGVELLANSGRVDVIIVGRGGGSIEDLWEFNDERLARAIYASPVPVISAVGHETDFTICDFVADVRAATPSMAAELLSNGYMELRQRVERSVSRAELLVRHRLRDARRRIDAILGSHALRRPELRLRELQQRVDDLLARLPEVVRQRSERLRAQSQRALAAIEGHNPQLILSKGYAIVRSSDGQVLTRAVELVPGEGIRLTMQDGEKTATVNS